MHALPYTLGVFALILILSRLKVPLAPAIFVGAIVMGLLFGLTGTSVAGTIWAGVIQPRTIAMALITMLLLSLSVLMQHGGQLEEIVSLAGGLLRRPAVAMAALPALIGLLPMPGGALFSAPMVRSAAGDTQVDRSMLSAINYWFRHLWEHWWPLYPGVILAMGLTGSAYLPFAACQLPLGIFMVLGGLLLIYRVHPDLRIKAARPPPGTRRKLLRATSSIWVILVVSIPMRYAVDWLDAPWLSPEMTECIKRYVPGR